MADKQLLAQIAHLLRPHATRIANMVARAVVQLADDSKKLQLLQLGVLAGETVDNAEHFQPYGFTSVPLAGAEALVVFPNGDRSHPIVIGTPDRQYRPTGGEAGSVTLYHYKGGSVTMLANGNIQLTPGPGGEVIVSAGGTTDRLVTVSEFTGHTHGATTIIAPGGGGGGPCTGVTGGAASVPGTQKLQSE